MKYKKEFQQVKELEKTMSKIKIPKKIEPDAIIDAICEIRFEPKVDGEAVFGIIYNSIKNEYNSLQKLPILQLPLEIRENDPSFKYKPAYKLTSKKSKQNFCTQIGSNVISISNTPCYSGWEAYFIEIKNITKQILETDVIKNISRIGLRYVNVFDKEDIYEFMNFDFKLNESKFNPEQLTLKTTIKNENQLHTLRIANKGDVLKNDNIITGSLIDIDTYCNIENNIDEKSLYEIINGLHESEKKLFFSLLKEKFIKSLNPTF